MITAEPTGFEAFWQLYVLTYGAPILQILLWVVQIVFFTYGMVLLKRWVDFATGRKSAAAVEAVMAQVAAPAAEKPKADSIKVEEFVE